MAFSRRAGFTLIELIVVLTVIAILSAMVVPQFASTFHDSLLRATARELLVAMNLASSQAIATSRPHRLRLDPERGRYSIEGLTELEEGESGFRRLADVPGSSGILDPRISARLAKGGTGGAAARSRGGRPPDGQRSGEESIFFLPDGTSEAAEVHLRDRNGFGFVLRVNPVTSRVRLLSLGREEPP